MTRLNTDAPAFSPAAPAAPAAGRAAQDPRTAFAGLLSDAILHRFSVPSSLGHPFLVVSPGRFVEGVDDPNPAEFGCLLEAVAGFVRICAECRAVLIVDFEGDMPGYGGEIVCAQLMWTNAIEAKTLAPPASGLGATPCLPPGMLIDMRDADSRAIVKGIMETESITKLIWGADGDCVTLANPLGADAPISSRNVVDVQLGFSTPSRRIGLARILDTVKAEEQQLQLSKKDAINYDWFHARNLRAFQLPMSKALALYSTDDIHRIELIIRTQNPMTGSYHSARELTATVIQRILSLEGALEELESKLAYACQRQGDRKQQTCVEIVRASRHLRAIFAQTLSPLHEDALAHAESFAVCSMVVPVVIPADLSFASE